ncbi:hypothetical protein ZEAMMB73_Zm00001d040336 [Zea mays]|uniref:Uncharacterized protein n=1 Tax=Zea mays TaxID=4577 RepID=A0A1D6MQ92_MAIZE|nr:hypothetical protein ZEAMMB73_Zm00001d040336 [Zea mays]
MAVSSPWLPFSPTVVLLLSGHQQPAALLAPFHGIRLPCSSLPGQGTPRSSPPCSTRPSHGVLHFPAPRARVSTPPAMDTDQDSAWRLLPAIEQQRPQPPMAPPATSLAGAQVLAPPPMGIPQQQPYYSLPMAPPPAAPRCACPASTRQNAYERLGVVDSSADDAVDPR